MRADSWPQQRDDGSKLLRVIARILQGRVTVPRIPQLRVKRPLGRAEGDMAVTPESVDSDRVLGCGVRPRQRGVDQVRNHGALANQLPRLLRHERPLLL